MTNREKYDDAFVSTFMIEPSILTDLKYQSIETWDSVGHMALMATLEGAYGIEMDIDDIISFSSYKIGQAILAKYKISMDVVL